MNLFFEESGDFKAGVALSQQGEAFQVELQTGKRTKVRAKDVLLQFASPSPADIVVPGVSPKEVSTCTGTPCSCASSTERS